ncbi:MAG: GTP-binding protein [Planctomycetota bacterium]
MLTGFLGSGKTTILRELLERSTARIAVLVNEVGELSLDHALLERVDEDVLALPGGCICCTMRDDLGEALARVRAHAPDHVVVETTGLADPAPILHGVGADPRLAAEFALASTTAVVDVVRADELLDEHAEVRRQLDFADRVVLTKRDLAPQRERVVRERLEREAPGREVVVAEHGRVEPAWLLAPRGFTRDGAAGWLRAGALGEATHESFTTHSVRREAPVDVGALQLWLRLVTQLDGHRLLRIKAIVRDASGRCFALHAAGHAVSPPREMAVAPGDVRGAEVVVIERGMEPRAMELLLESLGAALGAPARPFGAT